MNDTAPQWMVETHDLTRIYGDGEQIFALNGVNLLVAPGELVTVMGPSGSGKSTLLNMIGALDRPTRGQVFVNGKNLASIKNYDAFRGSTIGFVFQLHNLLPTLTARENVEIPLAGYAGRAERKRRSEELMGLVGLQDRMNHLPGQLSGGQRQRVAVARALANNPPLVLADEPTGSLDTAAGGELMDLLHQINQSQGTTFLVVTHDISVARQTHRVVVMCDGRILREDLIGSAFEEDLKMWRFSHLGQKIISGSQEDLGILPVDKDQLETLRRFLKKAESV
jgi:ABC-type lipoprotein export system ATPase subunit